MSRYLQRVLARTAGRPLGSLQAPQPRRWSSLPSDPFAAVDEPNADAAALPIVARRQADRRADDEAPRSASALGSTGAGRALNEATQEQAPQPRRALRGYDLPDPLVGPPLRASARNGAQPEHHLRRGSSAASESNAPSTVGALRSEPALRRPPGAPPARSSPARPPQPSAAGVARDARARDERRTEPSPALMPQPSAARRDELATRAPAEPPQTAHGTAADARPATVMVAPHPTAHAAAAAPSAGREIVIGRISVVVENSRVMIPATRTVVNHVTTRARTADEAPGQSHRFGLGQL